MERGFKWQENGITSEVRVSEKSDYWVDCIPAKVLKIIKYFPLKPLENLTFHIFLPHRMHLKFREVKGNVPSYISEHWRGSYGQPLYIDWYILARLLPRDDSKKKNLVGSLVRKVLWDFYCIEGRITFKKFEIFWSSLFGISMTEP